MDHSKYLYVLFQGVGLEVGKMMTPLVEKEEHYSQVVVLVWVRESKVGGIVKQVVGK